MRRGHDGITLSLSVIMIYILFNGGDDVWAIGGEKRNGACVSLEMEFSGGARAGISSVPLLIERVIFSLSHLRVLFGTM